LGCLKMSVHVVFCRFMKSGAVTKSVTGIGEIGGNNRRKAVFAGVLQSI